MVLLVLNSKKNEWEQITQEEKKNLPPEEKEKVLFLSNSLRKKLDFGLKQQTKDNDVVGIVSGDEGSGKSSLAGNIMRYISKDKFNPRVDMIGSDYDKGIEIIDRAKKKGFIMFDEGNVFFLSTEIMKREQRNLHKLFSIFRQKNLFVLIVLPSFFRLGSYFALDRSRFLCRTYLKGAKRGLFAYYGEKAKKKLYREGKREHNVNAVKPLFRGKFSRCYLLESEDYKKFKLKTLMDSVSVAKGKKRRTEFQIKRDLEIGFVKTNMDRKNSELAELMQCSEDKIKQIKKRLRAETEDSLTWKKKTRWKPKKKEKEGKTNGVEGNN